MGAKIKAVFHWFMAILVVLFLASAVISVIDFFHTTIRNNATVTSLVETCTANGGELSLVQWKYGCARLENGGERQVNCQVLECLGK